jgi:uncharacterized protein YodC (DUF2158 family)
MKKYIETSIDKIDLNKELEEFEKNSKFKLGDTVKLKGGLSPIMVVTDYNIEKKYIGNSIVLIYKLECSWYTKGRSEFSLRHFVEEALEFYTLDNIVKEIIEDIRINKT